MGKKSRELADKKFDIIKVNNCYVNEINKIVEKNGKR